MASAESAPAAFAHFNRSTSRLASGAFAGRFLEGDLRGDFVFALAMTAVLRANGPCRRGPPAAARYQGAGSGAGVGDAGLGLADRRVEKAERALAMAALVGCGAHQLGARGLHGAQRR